MIDSNNGTQLTANLMHNKSNDWFLHEMNFWAEMAYTI